MIDQHCNELDRCNQRGGRMLSVVDLLDAGTVDLDVAAFLAACISGGSSFLIGAVPGGAGKTTIMAALLNFLPAGVPIVPATDSRAVRAGLRADASRACYLCQEIGAGAIDGYLWGEDARDFFRLTRRGHLVATNLHCDTIEQTREQLCRDNPVDEDDFRRVNLMAFITFARDRVPRLSTVWRSDGAGEHRLVFRWDSKRDVFESIEQPDVATGRFKPFLGQLVRDDARTIRQVRGRVVALLEEDE